MLNDNVLEFYSLFTGEEFRNFALKNYDKAKNNIIKFLKIVDNDLNDIQKQIFKAAFENPKISIREISNDLNITYIEAKYELSMAYKKFMNPLRIKIFKETLLSD